MTDPVVEELASRVGIATQFWNWRGEHSPASHETLVKVLAAMGYDASTSDAARRCLDELELRDWRRPLPVCVVAREGEPTTVWAHVPDGADAALRIELEFGGEAIAVQVDDFTPAREVDGQMVGQASFALPGELPTGYHTLVLTSGEATHSTTLIVVPRYLDLPESVGQRRLWGFMTQLYSVQSAGSWGLGDLGDLADLLTWSATQHSADYMLVNPLHATQTTTPLDDSPYLPASRLFYNATYIRPELIEEYAELDAGTQAGIADLKKQSWFDGDEHINRDQSWTAKIQALTLIHAAGRREVRQMSFDEFRERQGTRLRDFATWSMLSEIYGNNWREWPEELQSPTSAAVEQMRDKHATRVEFFQWLQWTAWDQQREAQAAATGNGMGVGIVTDLAVGVAGSSADTWVMADIYADSVSVGAPPDGYNQMGQNWGQPPWHPDRLAETAYEPFRAMLRSTLDNAGGVRIDHILGMFRLWWIPEGNSAADGVYVSYDHDAMVGIIMLEAQRAGAFVVGEDLGTVEPWVRDYLGSRGIFGTSVLWFEYGSDGQPVEPQHWRELTMGSVITHDLPPTAGYLAGDHLRLQASLGLLTRSVEDELAGHYDEMGRWRDRLVARGFLDDDKRDDIEAITVAVYAYLASTNVRILNVALVDAVGDRMIQNQPGTWKEYPNWRVWLSDPSGQPITLEQVYDMDLPGRIAEQVRPI